MLFKPFKHSLYTAGSQGTARIRRAIIQVEGVALGSKGVATRKDDVVHIPAALVGAPFLVVTAVQRGSASFIIGGLAAAAVFLIARAIS